MKNDLIVLYVDKDTPTPEDIPSISMPYKDIKAFDRENLDLKALSTYSKTHLLTQWGVQKQLEDLLDIVTAHITDRNTKERRIRKLEEEAKLLNGCIADNEESLKEYGALEDRVRELETALSRYETRQK